MTRRCLFFLAALAVMLAATALVFSCGEIDDGDDDDDNDAGGADDDDDTGDDDADEPGPPLIPGPGQAGYDAELEQLARMYDRSFHAFNALGMAVNTEATVPLSSEQDRELIEDFLRESDGWDFEAYSGKHAFDVISHYHKVAGLYGGSGIAADAFRYGVLRDQGYDEAEVEIARDHLLDALEALHIAVAITGAPGVVARGFQRLDIPGNADQIELTPLFDQEGNPLPTIKNNGTWRADNSEGGLYPNYIWEDSCSRDMFVGWVTALAAGWEVIRDDPTFPEDLKERLREDAREIGLQLKVVRPSGYDLEIIDADGRTTFHGYINENAVDRVYVPFLPFKNGMHSSIALGCLAGLNYVAQDPLLDWYLYDHLIGERHLDEIARSNQLGVDLWVKTNYSGVNFTFQGAWLAYRYLEDPAAGENIRQAFETRLYDKPFWHERQPREQKQSLYDFMYAASAAGSTAWNAMFAEPDPVAVAGGIETLKEFPVPPYWNLGVVNCDQEEIEQDRCLCADGVTEIDLMKVLGRGDKLVSVQPVPMRTRTASNYHWRSNPYEVNGDGDGSLLLSGVDFRWAYWLGRWAR